MVESKKDIELYLRYLRDISRKIAIRSDFSSIFLNRTKKRNSYTYQIKDIELQDTNEIGVFNPIHEYLSLVTRYLNKYPEKKLFLGIGLICGLPKIAGPLIVCKCDVELHEDGHIVLEFNTDRLMVNYELITKVIEKRSNRFLGEDETEFDTSIEKDSKVVDEIERLILETGRNKGIGEIQQLSTKVIEILKNLDEFSDILILPTESYDYKTEIERFYKKKTSSVFGNGKLTFINANHLFISSVPSEISVYEELSKLVNEISGIATFENPILEKLLNSVFSNEKVSINYDEETWEKVSDILHHLLKKQ